MKAFNTIVLALVATSTLAVAQDIYLLGDSLSDNGNGYAAFTELVLQTDDVYPQQPYYQGRWSNGPVWIELAADQFGVDLYDYGAGGATSGTAPAQVPSLPVGFGGLTQPTTVLSPNIYQQLNNLLLETNSTLDPDAVYIILIGVNDYLSTVFQGTNVTADDVMANINTIVDTLYEYGAQNFIFGTVPTVDTLPVFTHPSLYGYYNNASVANINTQVRAQNQMLQDLATNISEEYDDANADVFDFAAAFMTVVQNAQQNGLTNLQDACYVSTPQFQGMATPSAQPIGLGGGQECPDPNTHLFWDQFHPGAVAHSAIGDAFVNEFGEMYGQAPAPAPGASSS